MIAGFTVLDPRLECVICDYPIPRTLRIQPCIGSFPPKNEKVQAPELQQGVPSLALPPPVVPMAKLAQSSLWVEDVRENLDSRRKILMNAKQGWVLLFRHKLDGARKTCAD
jgi:hypothetical protein